MSWYNKPIKRKEVTNDMLHKDKKKGFTLAELLIVVAIIAVLVGISIPIFSDKTESARRAVDIANARDIKGALQVSAMTGEINFSGEKSAIWIIINNNEPSVGFGSENGSYPPSINGTTLTLSNAKSQITTLLQNNGIDITNMKVNAKKAKDTGSHATADGWTWYVIILTGDNKAYVRSFPGNYTSAIATSFNYSKALQHIGYKDTHLERIIPDN